MLDLIGDIIIALKYYVLCLQCLIPTELAQPYSIIVLSLCTGVFVAFTNNLINKTGNTIKIIVRNQSSLLSDATPHRQLAQSEPENCRLYDQNSANERGFVSSLCVCRRSTTRTDFHCAARRESLQPDKF